MDSITIFEILGKAPLGKPAERRIHDACLACFTDTDVGLMFANELRWLANESGGKMCDGEKQRLAEAYADWAVNPTWDTRERLRAAVSLHYDVLPCPDDDAKRVETSNPLPCPDDDDIVLELIDAPAASSDWTEDELDAAIAALAPLLF
jgi:hypothetical protein